MNSFYQTHLQNKHLRRGLIFQDVLDTFSGPMNILEVGAINSLNHNEIVGAGWSTFWWCDYIKENGGKLVVVDRDGKAIDCCREAVADFIDKINIEFHALEATPLISSAYDHGNILNFVYLDGSNCETETKNQFSKIDRSQTSILCDDFDRKGGLLQHDLVDDSSTPNIDNYKEGLKKEFYLESVIVMAWDNDYLRGHRMGFYPRIIQ